MSKPNNHYYRQISEELNPEIEYGKFHSTVQYLKDIAESYGNVYTGFNRSNVYMHDWCVGVGASVDTGRHFNLEYLRMIVKQVKGFKADSFSENKCLEILTDSFDYIINIYDEDILDNYQEIYSLSNLLEYFYYNENLKNVKLNLSSATNCSSMLMNCFNLSIVELDLPSATNCSYMLSSCSNLSIVELDLPSAIDCSYMLYYCASLTNAELDLPSATNCSSMLAGCINLIDIDLNLPSATNCNMMFFSCTSLTNVKLNIPSLTNYERMFYNCPNLETIDVTIPSNLITNFRNYVLGLNLTKLKSFIINGKQQICNDMTLTSNKDIIQIGESATLTAQLLYDDEPLELSGQTVTFEVRKESDDSLIETLTGTTNSAGLCSVSYVSKGEGSIYIKATCMSLIQIYELEDNLWIDIATTGKSRSTDWYGRNNMSTVRVDDDGTFLENTITENSNYLANDPSTSGDYYSDTADWDNCVYEFDIIEYTGNCYYFNENDRVASINRTGHFKVVNDSSTKIRCGFQLRTNGSLKYANFKIYSI